MPKINNTNRYPVRTANEITDSFLLLASESATSGSTVNVSIASIKALLASMKSIKVTLSSASSYQNNEFLDKSYVFCFVSGQEGLTGGLISAFDPNTGTVTFNDAFGAISGEVIFVTQA